MLPSIPDQPPRGNATVDDGSLLTLASDLYEVVIEPGRGALIRQISWKGGDQSIDLLYSPAEKPRSADGINFFGCWPLVPFANRCFGGKLIAADSSWQLPINELSSGNAMHGYGWQCAWPIEKQSETSATLSHRCDGDFGPYRYRCEMTISIEGPAVVISLTVTNKAAERLPFGLGLHPWFACDAATEFCVGDARRKVDFASGYRALAEVALDRSADFFLQDKMDRAGEIVVNYVGWRGPAQLTYPNSHRLAISASLSLDMPLLWRPPGVPFVCFEPQSHVIGAPADPRAADISPMRTLDPGETLSGWIRLEASTDA